MTAVTAAGLPVMDEPALRGLLGPVDRSKGSRVLVVAAAPEWHGPEVIESEAGPVRIVVGHSVLAVRAALVEHAGEFLVVVTPLDVAELGEEVRARAWGRRVVRPSRWDAVKALFKVDAVDPALRGQEWMIDLLVRLAPARGYRQPRSQVLDRDTAWRTLSRYGLLLDADRPTTAHLLDWASSPAAASALERIDEADRERIASHLAAVAGPAAGPLLRLVAAGRGADAVPLGLVADALWPGSDPVTRVLLAERHLDRQPLDDAAALDWGQAAVAWVRRSGADPDSVQEVVAGADVLLTEVDAGATGDSAVLDRTFASRLGRLGSALSAALDALSAGPAGKGCLDEAEAALAAVRSHLRAEREPGRVRRAEAALRVCRREVLGKTGEAGRDEGPSRASGLATLARRYVEDGAWVDAARHRLAEGETEPALVAVYDRLADRVDADRAARDRAFAAALAGEGVDVPVTAPDLDGSKPLPIEAVLGAVVAPVARLAPVVLLVVDGLSHAAATELLGDLRREGWRSHGPGGQGLPPVVAALPTVTRVSRASLLCGRLASGGQDVEREGFASNPTLVEAGDGQAPVLYHKADLGSVAGEIAPGVRETLADPSQRVVGVVVNALDDHLDKGTQLRLADGLEGVPLLRPVLEAAAEARRVVVLASDHGHILGAGQRVVAAPGGGERFRPAGEAAAPDEVEVSGARVLLGAEQRVVLAAEDGVRYIPAAKHGYHGGATPAEVLCPLAVLLHGAATLDGWEPLPVSAPAWWDPASAPVEVEGMTGQELAGDPAAPGLVATRGREAPAPEPDDRQLSLLDEPAPAAPAAGGGEPASEWLSALLASPRLAEQRRLAGRAVLDDRDLGTLLRVLVASGGRASGAALQRTLGLSPSRLRGKLQAARDLLDVEGYAVLRVEPDGTAILNLDHLTTQFEVPRALVVGQTAESPTQGRPTGDR